MISLNNITLCAVDCLNHKKAISAMLYSMQNIIFDKCIFISDKNELKTDKIEFAQIKKINSKEEYSAFVLRDLVKYINTDYVLLMQYDGFIINPDSWSEKFLQYDYIGAPWKNHDHVNKVGNGGFSLRSKKLMQYISNKYQNKPIIFNEDLEICYHSYNELVNNEFKFPDLKTAFEFSIEHKTEEYNEKPFGFHGFPFTKIGMESKMKILDWSKNESLY